VLDRVKPALRDTPLCREPVGSLNTRLPAQRSFDFASKLKLQRRKRRRRRRRR